MKSGIHFLAPMSRWVEHPLFRSTALVAVLGVFALALLAASPEWHHRLHAGEPAGQTTPVGDADHVCAVTLFAAGLTGLLVFCLLIVGRRLAAGTPVRPGELIAVAPPRYQLVPSHAPPAV